MSTGKLLSTSQQPGLALFSIPCKGSKRESLSTAIQEMQGTEVFKVNTYIFCGKHSRADELRLVHNCRFSFLSPYLAHTLSRVWLTPETWLSTLQCHDPRQMLYNIACKMVFTKIHNDAVFFSTCD